MKVRVYNDGWSGGCSWRNEERSDGKSVTSK